jgi:N-carbamoyl-L-amino-acid hydrolase
VCANCTQGPRLPFDLEVVAFAEEEGQRYKATFLGSGALIGRFQIRMAGSA